MSNFHIAMFPKIQADTAICYFILKTFGGEKFPGIENAPISFWTELPQDKTIDELEQEGYILIDLGDSKFDHHKLGPDNKTISASHLMAKFLGVDEKMELQKLLEFARRDDLEGKGTLSLDPIDRAFGLSGLLTSLNKSNAYTSEQILDILMPFLYAHYEQQRQQYEQLPKELNEGKQRGTVKEFSALQFGKQLKVIYIESDNPAMASFLRSKDIGAHVVVQKASTGHVNFITKQVIKLQLHKLARHIKLLEAEKNDLTLQIDNMIELEKPGRTQGLPHWYYDTRANTLQNGGVNPQEIPVTKLTYEEIELAVKQGLNVARMDAKGSERPNNGYGNHNRDNNRRFNNRGRRDHDEGFRRSHGAIIID